MLLEGGAVAERTKALQQRGNVRKLKDPRFALPAWAIFKKRQQFYLIACLAMVNHLYYLRLTRHPCVTFLFLLCTVELFICNGACELAFLKK